MSTPTCAHGNGAALPCSAQGWLDLAVERSKQLAALGPANPDSTEPLRRRRNTLVDQVLYFITMACLLGLDHGDARGNAPRERFVFEFANIAEFTRAVLRALQSAALKQEFEWTSHSSRGELCNALSGATFFRDIFRPYRAELPSDTRWFYLDDALEEMCAEIKTFEGFSLSSEDMPSGMPASHWWWWWPEESSD